MTSISKNVLIDKLGDVVNKYNTARIQRFKEVSQTDWFKSFPLQLSGHEDTPPLSFPFISARSVENCISVERLNTLNTDLQSILHTSKNLQPAKQGLFLLIPEAAVHMNFAVNLTRFFRTPFLYCIDNLVQIGRSKKSRKIHILCWNLFVIKLQASGLQIY